MKFKPGDVICCYSDYKKHDNVGLIVDKQCFVPPGVAKGYKIVWFIKDNDYYISYDGIDIHSKLL